MCDSTDDFPHFRTRHFPELAFRVILWTRFRLLWTPLGRPNRALRGDDDDDEDEGDSEDDD